MSVILIRSLILYILVIFAVRLMGKRQLGELQPSELVITILVSNIATLPIEDVDIPLIVGITPILSMVCFEVIVSWLSLHSVRVRKLISGSPKIVISGGQLDPQVLRELRFSVDDLTMALRGKDVFDLSEVQFAVVETTGSVSVMKKPSEEVPTRGDMGLSAEDSDPPQVIVSDGRLVHASLRSLGLGEEQVTAAVSKAGFQQDEVFIMTSDDSGSFCLIPQAGGEAVRGIIKIGSN